MINIIEKRNMNVFLNKPTPTPLQGGEQWNSYFVFQYIKKGSQ